MRNLGSEFHAAFDVSMKLANVTPNAQNTHRMEYFFSKMASRSPFILNFECATSRDAHERWVKHA